MADEKPKSELAEVADDLTGKLKGVLPGGKFLPAVYKAWEKMTASKESWTSKIGIFFKTFIDEWRGVQKEEKKTSKEAEDKVKQSLGDTMKSAEGAVTLDANVQGEDRDLYTEVLAVGVRNMKELAPASQASAFDALAKLGEKCNGGSVDVLTYEEVAGLAAAGLLTVKELKRRYPDRASFKSVIYKLSTISDSSKYPLKKLLMTSTLSIFKLKDEEQGLKLFKALGISPSIGDIGSIVGMGKGEASDAKNILTKLADDPMTPESEGAVVGFMRKYVFKNSEEENVKKIVGLINRMIREKSDNISAENLTEFVFLTDDRDFDHLIAILGGPKLGPQIVQAEDAAKSNG